MLHGKQQTNFQGDRLKQLLDAMEESQDFQVGIPVVFCYQSRVNESSRG